MKLSDLRKVATRQNVRVRFRLPNGMECILDEHGLARIPALKSIPDFNLEQEFAKVNEFVLEPVILEEKQKHKSKPRMLSREQLAALAAPAAGAAARQGDHDDE